jgi:TRAP-type C4-dicarboxylate transport system permease small subunit
MSRNSKKLVPVFLRLADIVPRISVFVAGASLCVMLILVLAEVLARNIFQYGLPFTVEYSEYAIPVIGLVGAAYTLHMGGHVKVEILLDKLPQTAKTWLTLIGNLVGLGLMALLAQQSFTMAFSNIETNALVLYPTLTPLGYPQLIMGFGFSLFSLQLFFELVKNALNLRFSAESHHQHFN